MCRDLRVAVDSVHNHALHRNNLIFSVGCPRLFRVTQSRAIAGNNARQPCRVAVSGQNILRTDILDIGKFIFGADIANRDKFNPFRVAFRDVHKQGAEIADTLALFQTFNNLVFHFGTEIRVIGVDNPARMRPVVIVAAAKNGGLGVEQGGRP
ncbi:Uncharacterised protein [Yersinia enterocolitica]|nr:Uncharacterised protein [Yersinia enterocolitica]CNE59881.1 Uncharacterised protein [Yersinia enterocolitica]